MTNGTINNNLLRTRGSLYEVIKKKKKKEKNSSSHRKKARM